MKQLLLSWIVCWMILLIANVEATEPVRLTHDGSLKRDPRFADGGNELVYCYDEAPDLIVKALSITHLRLGLGLGSGLLGGGRPRP